MDQNLTSNDRALLEEAKTISSERVNGIYFTHDEIEALLNSITNVNTEDSECDDTK